MLGRLTISTASWGTDTRLTLPFERVTFWSNAQANGYFIAKRASERFSAVFRKVMVLEGWERRGQVVDRSQPPSMLQFNFENSAGWRLGAYSGHRRTGLYRRLDN